jgi:hypothetical protein
MLHYSAWQLFWLLSKELGVCFQSSGHPDFNRIYDFSVVTQKHIGTKI